MFEALSNRSYAYEFNREVISSSIDIELDCVQSDDGNEFEKDDMILHDIVLHSNTKVLKIWGFGGVRLSSSANLFTNLYELDSSNCTRLQYFELSLLHVKRLHMYNLPCLECIVNDSNRDNSSPFCASLTNIFLSE